MTTIKKTLLAAALAVPATLVATGAAHAQATGGVAVADLQAAIESTKAAQAAATQIRTANASAITQIQARQQAAQTELQPLVTKFQADQRANVAQATLQSEAATIQARENAARTDIARLGEPIQRAQAYVTEQIQPKLQQAVQTAMTQRNVTLLLKPDSAFVVQPASDLTQAITAQLDTLVPSVGSTPPAGWQPGQAAGAAAPGRPATATPTGNRRNSGR
jgi:Skp family chaperone for outer membrane proteins